MLDRLHADFAKKGEWFFNAWQPDKVRAGKSGKAVPFHQAEEQQLVTDPSCLGAASGCRLARLRRAGRRLLHARPDQGFDRDAGGRCRTASWPRPASRRPCSPPISDQRGIEVEKTTDFTILFLFSLGITKGKWGTLVNALLDFKTDYDANKPLERVLPMLVAGTGDAYAGMGLKDLATKLFDRDGQAEDDREPGQGLIRCCPRRR